MKTTHSMVLCLLVCNALAFGCGDTFDEEIPDEASDEASNEATPVDVTSPDADPCAEDVEGLDAYDLRTREAALEAYARLRVACSGTVHLDRRGKPDTIEIEIK
ncbi:MAG TPA: hypothetical protein VJU61_07710 [Polyangiaceae bacterium]|nr:hypothetical protein [Polyangiaceae bacterium]